MKLKSARGFTMVELLVVITIIAILTILAISTYSGAQKRTRDTKRIADVDAIAKSAIVYAYSNRKSPPSPGGVESSIEGSSGSDWPSGVGTFKDAITPFIAQLPLDPLNGKNSCGTSCAYYYTSNMWCKGGFVGSSCSANIPAVYTYLENCTNSGDAGMFGFGCIDGIYLKMVQSPLQ